MSARRTAFDFIQRAMGSFGKILSREGTRSDLSFRRPFWLLSGEQIQRQRARVGRPVRKLVQ